MMYTFAIGFYNLLIHIASINNEKARLWVRGRKNVFDELFLQCKSSDKYIWVHCASLGEFEQARAFIELLKQKKPEFKIVLTFFSPSGYEVRKNYPSADIITYLPIDTPKNAKRFLSIVHPQYIFFIKYEYWFNYINHAYKQHIPFYVVSAIFRKNQRFFKFYGFWFRKELKKITYFFTQNEESKKLLNSINISQCGVYGDTRFDTVSTLQAVKYPIIDSFCENNRIMLAGSSWLEDEKLLFDYIKNNTYKWIIVPHEINETHLQQIKYLYKNLGCVFYSEVSPETDFSDVKILIVNIIGILRNIYHYAEVAYIGGGFGKGIHNVLEAATFSKPIIFGPNYRKFKEACDLIAINAAFPVKDENELSAIFTKLNQDKDLLFKASNTASNYVLSQIGASRKILSAVFSEKPDTNS
ncbi:MAG: 3-deoxy-D-manno-octulosonic acid transferase [Bacteroidales bacterium]|nr:3-deoxy-D-manno-octulosonic acid transferase [Bacteroidales bacterium]